MWKSLSHGNPTSSEVSGLNPGRSPLMNEAAIPGAGREARGYFSALG